MKKQISILLCLCLTAISSFAQQERVANGQDSYIEGEYFFDEDPGMGQGEQFYFDSYYMENLGIQIPDSLEKGSHTLYMRSVQWGVDTATGEYKPTYSFVKKAEFTIRGYDFIAGEYFFDKDPGYGKGIALNASLFPAESLNSEFEIQPDASLGSGEHTVYIRLLNERGVWTLHAKHTFKICGDVTTAPKVQGAFLCQEGGIGTLKVLEADTLATYEWFEEPYGGTPIHTGTEFTTPFLSSTKKYYVSKGNSAQVCGSSSRILVKAEVVEDLQAPTDSNFARCGAGKLTLLPEGAPLGGSYNWYLSDTASTPAFENQGFIVTDSLFADSTFYVTSILNEGQCESDLRAMITAQINYDCDPQILVVDPVGTQIIGVDDEVKLIGKTNTGNEPIYEIVTGPAEIDGNVITPTDTGTVTVIAYHPGDDKVGPSNIVEFNFKVVANNAFIVAKASHNPVCVGDRVSLVPTNLSGIVSYEWTGPNNFYSNEELPAIIGADSDNAGYYKVTVKTSTGQVQSDSLELVVNSSPDKVKISGLEIEKCKDKSYELVAEGDSSILAYQWYIDLEELIGATSNELTPMVTGVYSVEAYDTNGCTVMSAPLYLDLNPENVPTITHIDSLSRLQSSAGATYQWYVNKLIIVGGNQQELPLVVNGSYQVEVTTAEGCTYFSQPFVVADDNLPTLQKSASEIDLEFLNNFSLMSLSPNPANKQVRVSLNATVSQDFMDLEVYDLLGNTLLNTQIGDEQLDLDISDLSTGVYFVVLRNGSKVYRQKLIVE